MLEHKRKRNRNNRATLRFRYTQSIPNPCPPFVYKDSRNVRRFAKRTLHRAIPTKGNLEGRAHVLTDSPDKGGRGLKRSDACSGIKSVSCTDTSSIIKAGNVLGCVLTSLLVCVLNYFLSDVPYAPPLALVLRHLFCHQKKSPPYKCKLAF